MRIKKSLSRGFLLAVLVCMSEVRQGMAAELAATTASDPATYDRLGIPDLVQKMKDGDSVTRNLATQALVRKGSAAVPALIQTVNHANEPVRLSAVAALGNIGDARAIPTLLRAAKAKDIGLNTAGLQALDNLRNPQTVPALIPLFAEEGPAREAAMEAVGHTIPFPKQAILQALGNKNSKIRSGAIEVLGHSKDTSEIPRISKFMKTDESEEVRCAAARALGHIGDSKAIGDLLGTLQTQTTILCIPDACNALAQIAGPQVVSGLLKIAGETQDVLILSPVISTLGQIQDPSAIPVLIEHLKDHRVGDEDSKTTISGYASGALNAIGKPAIPALVQTLAQEKDPLAREAAAQALWGTDDKTAMAELTKAARQDKDPRVRTAAEMSIQRYHPEDEADRD